MISANDKKTSCPHQYNMIYKPVEGYFTGYSVFTDQSNKGVWQIRVDITINNQKYMVFKPYQFFLKKI
ncbi:hypothetical protein [Flavobacterium oreochromis]|uniref:hypothetical protein n=1 Tax=Flavobacterium oreochromis TaxID=2906078 RepID=UPI0021644AD0|nr:hypothetical protein [Flavobacterium oreochromis]